MAAVTRGVRLFANSTEELVFEAKKLAATQVPKGEKGSIQDLINHVFSALSQDPRLCDELYWKGKPIFETQVKAESYGESKMSAKLKRRQESAN